MALLIRKRLSFLFSQFLPSGSFHKPLILIHQRTDRMKTTITKKLIKLITRTTALSNSMKLWAMLCRATQDGRVMVESSDKTWSTGEGNGTPFHSMKRQKDRILKDEIPVGAKYATGEEWRNKLQKEWRDGAKAKITSSCGCDWWWR